LNKGELKMPSYEVYLIKKDARLMIIDADSFTHAEQLGYDFLANEQFENDTIADWDRYVYVDREITE
jgi:hypothetical protein